MKKLIYIYKGKHVYPSGFGPTLQPNGLEPDAVYDAENLTAEEVEIIRKNPKSNLLKKAKKIK